MSAAWRKADPLSPRPDAVGEMFTGITARYDLLNRVMSLGFDQAWRREAVRLTEVPAGGQALDLCCGTADLSIELALSGARPIVTGVDVSAGMLRRGREKVSDALLEDRVRLVRADVLRLPFGSRRFDAATIAFGLRNIAERAEAVREAIRVLRPGARLVVLEFSHPRPVLVRTAYHRYLGLVPPLLAKLLRVDHEAYRYLAVSVQAFPMAADLAALLEGAGLRQVEYRKRFFGTVALHTGRA